MKLYTEEEFLDLSFQEQCNVISKHASISANERFTFADIIVTMQLQTTGKTLCFAHVYSNSTHKYHFSSPGKETAKEALIDLFLLLQDTARIKIMFDNTLINAG